MEAMPRVLKLHSGADAAELSNSVSRYTPDPIAKYSLEQLLSWQNRGRRCINRVPLRRMWVWLPPCVLPTADAIAVVASAMLPPNVCGRRQFASPSNFISG